MAIVKRGQKWNLEDVGSGQMKYTAHASSVNYQDDSNQWQIIDCQLVESVELQWDYEVVKNYWHLYVNKNGTVRGIKTEDDTGVTWRPVGLGYYDNSTGELHKFIDFTYPNSPTVEKYKITWEGVYSGIDVECLVSADRMQTNVILSQTARDNLPKPSDYGITEKNCEVAVIYESNWSETSDLKKADDSSLNSSNDSTSDKVYIKNSGGTTSQTMPELQAFVQEKEGDARKILRRFYEDTKTAQNYIYETITYAELNALDSGSVVFDDSVEYTGAGDGSIYASGANYTTVHDASSGTVASVNNTVGQYKSGSNYGVFRVFMYFDTSGLDDGASISAANLKLCCETDNSTTDFDIAPYEGTQGTSLETGDYDAFNATKLTDTNWNTSNYSDENYITIALNSSGLALIDKTGNTFYCLRSLEDVNSSEPTDDEYVKFRASDDSGKEPKLEITYSTSSSSSASQSTSQSSSSSSESQSSSSSSSSESESQSQSQSSSSSSESESSSSSSESESQSQSQSSSSSSESESSSSSSESESQSQSSSSSSSSESESQSSSSSSESTSPSSSSSTSTSQSSSSSSSESVSSSNSSSSSSSRSGSPSSSSSSESVSSSSSSSQASVGADVAVRVSWSGGYQDFNWQEVASVKLDRVQGVDRFWKQSGYVQQYHVGKEYRQVTVNLDASYSRQTLSKIKTVWDLVDSYYHPKQLQLYYKLRIDSTYIMCQMDRDQMVWPYVAGYQAAREVQMIFVENSTL